MPPDFPLDASLRSYLKTETCVAAGACALRATERKRLYLTRPQQMNGAPLTAMSDHASPVVLSTEEL